MRFTLKASAKINWFLSVVSKRDDGYHNIKSAMQFISLYDLLSFESSPELVLVSDDRIKINDNLVCKTAALMKKRFCCDKGARIFLEKSIPIAAGLGGGSSDAACTIKGLNRLWGLNLSVREMYEIALKLGSDVPFFLNGPFAMVEGRGEIISSHRVANSDALLLVNPDILISSAWAYGAYTTKLTKINTDIKLFCQTLENKDYISLSRFVSNDLEAVVFRKYPQVEKIKRELMQNGAVISSMSGSGPTVFGVFNSLEEAERAGRNMGDKWHRVVMTQSDLETETI